MDEVETKMMTVTNCCYAYLIWIGCPGRVHQQLAVRENSVVGLTVSQLPFAAWCACASSLSMKSWRQEGLSYNRGTLMEW